MKKIIITIIFMTTIYITGVYIADAGTIIRAPNNLSLVGYWAMNEGTGTSVEDKSGFKHHGTTTAPWIQGKFGNALNFDGTSNNVGIGDPQTLRISGNMTWSAWVKGDGLETTANGYQIINRRGGGSGDGWELNKEDGLNNFRTRIINSAGTATTRESATIPLSGRWYYVVSVYDASAQTLDLYINGTLDNGTLTGTVPTSQNNTNNGHITIGRLPGNAQYWDGIIDEVRIYSRALSADEVQKLYQSGSIRVGARQDKIVPEGLVGYWSLNGEDTDWSTGSAIDRSGQGNNGDLRFLSTSTSPINGKVGQALFFDETDDLIRVASSTSLDDLPALTYTAWIKSYSYTPQGASTGDIIVSKTQAGTNGGKQFAFGAQNNLQWFISRNTTNAVWTSGGMPPTNEWSFVAATWDGTFNAGAGHIYLGTASTTITDVTETETLGSGTQSSDNGNPFIIGSRTNGDNLFHGIIDEVRVYNRVLSDAEIKKLYNAGLGTVNASRNNFLTNGLVGNWSFNGPDVDWSTGTAYDRSGQGNNGTFVGLGTSTSPAPGKVGQALKFDGSGDYIEAPYSASLNILGDVTISVWARAESFSGTTDSIDLVDFGDNADSEATNHSYQLHILLGSKKLRLEWEFGAGTNVLVDSSVPVSNPTGSWVHYIATRNVTTKEVTFYENGAQLGTTVTYANNPTGGTSAKFCIGTECNIANDFFDGLIDEVRIYNRALSPDEIKLLYNMGR